MSPIIDCYWVEGKTSSDQRMTLSPKPLSPKPRVPRPLTQCDRGCIHARWKTGRWVAPEDVQVAELQSTANEGFGVWV